MMLYHINRPEKSEHLDNQLRTLFVGPKVSIIHMFHCRAYKACCLLQTREIQGEVSGFGHNCTQSTAANPVPVTKEHTYCYNKKLTICQMDTLIKHSQCVPVKT